MKLKLSVVLLFILITGCAVHNKEIQTITSSKIIEYTIVVEGLEQEYYQEIINSFTKISGFIRYTTPVSRNGMLEIICKFYDSPNLQKSIYDELNNVFMVLSKSIDISNTFNSFRVYVTTY